MALKRINYVGINLTKKVKDWKLEDIDERIEDDTNKWEYTHAHGLKDLILLKCPYYSK